MRLSVENLSGERGGYTVFSGIDFMLEEGGALVVTGANGTGKSTLLRILTGLLAPASGQVRLDDAPEQYPSVAASAHYLAPLNAMKPNLTVEENLSFWRSFQGDGSAETGRDVPEALDMVDLPGIGYLPYASLSTGQRRRVAIARLLVSHRPLWLLDEPTSGLDTASEQRFAAIMNNHLAEGGMIVAATHLPLGLGCSAELRMGE